MPLDPAGNMSLVPSYRAQPGTTIRTEQHNPPLEDIANVMSMHLVRDGRNGMVGALNMGTFPVQNVGAGVGPNDAATMAQIAGAGPIGIVADFAGTTPPVGWMFCYGQTLSRTTYAQLFAVIGVTFGAGDNSTTFTLPDCRGRVTAGKDNMGGTSADRLTAPLNGDVLGQTGGAEGHVLTVAQMPAHDHGGTTGNGGSHSHTVQGFGPNKTPRAQPQAAVGTGEDTVNTSTAPNHTHPISAQGEGQAHSSIQPTIIFNKIIKVSL